MKIHGTYLIEQRDQYIFLKVIGPFNEYTAESVSNDLSDVLLNYSNELRVIVDFTEFEGGTPEIFNYTRKINELQNRYPIIGKAVVGKSDYYLKVMNHFDDEFSKQNVQFFDNIRSAEEWILSHFFL